jgi:hypothetical protein
LVVSPKTYVTLVQELSVSDLIDRLQNFFANGILYQGWGSGAGIVPSFDGTLLHAGVGCEPDFKASAGIFTAQPASTVASVPFQVGFPGGLSMEACEVSAEATFIRHTPDRLLPNTDSIDQT